MSGDKAPFTMAEKKKMPWLTELGAVKRTVPADHVIDKVMVTCGVVIAFARAATPFIETDAGDPTLGKVVGEGIEDLQSFSARKFVDSII